MPGTMEADPVRTPVPFDEQEVDRDLGVADVDPRAQRREVQRAVNWANQRDAEDDATDLVSKVCKIIDFKAMAPSLEKEADWEEFKFKMKVIASVLGIED